MYVIIWEKNKRCVVFSSLIGKCVVGWDRCVEACISELCVICLYVIYDNVEEKERWVVFSYHCFGGTLVCNNVREEDKKICSLFISLIG